MIQLGPAINQAFLKVTTALKGESLGVISSYSVTSTQVGLNTNLDVSVTVSEATQVTVSAPGDSESKSCNPSPPTNCDFSLTNVSANGTATIEAAAGGHITVNY